MIYKALVIGLGKIGMGYDFNLTPSELVATHAQALDFHEGFELVGGVDLDTQTQNEFSQKFGKPSYSNNIEAVQKLRPDIIVVSVPTQSHLVTLREIMGEYTPKMILLEKPLSYCSSEAKEILDISASRNLSIAVNYFRDYEPAYRRVLSDISNGLLGFPLKVVIHYSKGIINNGSHFIRYISHFMGDLTELKIIEKGLESDGEDPEPDIYLKFDRGAAFLIAHDEENFSHYEMEIIGPEGRFRFSEMGNIIKHWQVVNDPVFKGYRVLSADPTRFLPDIKKYQLHVYNNTHDYLERKAESHCDIQSMGNIVNIYEKIEDQLAHA